MTKKCQACGSDGARNHFKKWEQNRETELILCDACAEERGLVATSSGGESDIEKSLNMMLEDMEGVNESARGTVQCDGCGLLYSMFRETGRLGCPDCYAQFEQQLRPLLRRVHGAVLHTGRSPAVDDAHARRRRELRVLQDEMDRAVSHEQFEKAAQLRDRIRALKGDMPETRSEKA